MMTPAITGRRIEIACIVDIEQTADSLHAHAIPDGVDIRPGDTVVVHGAPSQIAFGERIQVTCSATVIRAGVLTRVLTQVTGLFSLMELFEVGFQPKEAT